MRFFIRETLGVKTLLASLLSNEQSKKQKMKRGQTMKKDVYDKFYKKVPQEQKELLRRFRSTHPYKHLKVDGATWKYTSCGQGKEALLILTGGTGIGETFFPCIMALEDEYRIVCPSYPPVPTIEGLMDGVMKILEVEDIHQVNIVGQSFGGILAQVIVRKYPDKVNKLVLSHTTTTPHPADQAIILKKTKRIGKALKMLSFLPLWISRPLFTRSISKLASTINTEETEFWKAYFHEMFSYMTKEHLLSHFKRIMDFSQNYTFSKDDLANWLGKILILESDDDQSISLSERDAIKEMYPQAQVHTFHGTGHLTLTLNREESIPVIRSFLKEDENCKRLLPNARKC
jgi:pimeloyl-ACP methyl ester carboxylesterase